MQLFSQINTSITRFNRNANITEDIIKLRHHKIYRGIGAQERWQQESTDVENFCFVCHMSRSHGCRFN